MEMSDQVLEFVRRREEAEITALILKNWKWVLDMIDRSVRSEPFRKMFLNMKDEDERDM